MGFVYFDNNATTRLDDQVLHAMLPFLQDQYGNASSIQHKLGRQANQAIAVARKQVADFLNVSDKEIFFNSGSTEAINTVIKGISKAYQRKGNHIITCSTEHKAVLTTCSDMEKEGMQITYLPVDNQGSIDLNELSENIRPDTVLVCLMAANNETGILHPIADIAQICNQKDVLFFCDATQWIGKIPLDLQEIKLDILCLSAHKFHGPKGAGALYIRRKSKPTQVPPLIVGGNQEHGFRGGTYAVPQLVGLGKALSIVDFQSETADIRDYFEKQLSLHLQEVEIHAQKQNRLPNTSNVHFKYVRGSELMTKLPDFAISSGSACVSGDRDPSHVLKAMGISDEEAFCSLRFSFSKYNNHQEIDQAILQLKNAVEHIRNQSPIWQMYKEGLL